MAVVVDILVELPVEDPAAAFAFDALVVALAAEDDAAAFAICFIWLPCDAWLDATDVLAILTGIEPVIMIPEILILE